MIRQSLALLSRCYTWSVLVLFLSVADQALGHAELLPASPTLLCLVLLAPFGLALLAKHCFTPTTPGPLRVIFSNSCVLGPFTLVALFAITLSILPESHWEEGGKWVFLVPYGLCITTASTLLGQYTFATVVLRPAIAASIILIAGSIWYDTLHPGTFADITNRAAGFPGNANFAALVAVMLCAAGLHFGSASAPQSLSLTPSTSRNEGNIALAISNIFLLTTTFSIICMTMSRSGLVNFSLLVGTFIFYRLIRSNMSPAQRSTEMLLLGLATVAGFAFFIAFTQMSSTIQGNSRLIRLLNNQQVDDGSAGTRLGAFREGINLIEAAPILGHGTGFSRTMSELPHNIYIQQWVNNGLPGLVSYWVFLLSAGATFLRRNSRNGVALIVAATVGGVFSHNIMDQRPFLILLGLLLGASQADQRLQGTGSWPVQHRIVAIRRTVQRPVWEGQLTPQSR